MIKEIKKQVSPKAAFDLFNINIDINNKNLTDCPFCQGRRKLRIYNECAYCYKCNYYGDYLDIIVKLTSKNLRDVLKDILTAYPVESTFDTLSLSHKNELKLLWDYWCQFSLSPSSECYLAERGLLGVEVSDFHDCASHHSIYYKLGLLTSYGNLFENRIIFPIKDGKGRIVHYQGRSLDSTNDLRWVSTRGQEPISNYLYGMDKFIPNAPVFVCEGITDSATLMAMGFNVLGTFGVNVNLVRHQPLFSKAKSITFCFDNDKDDKGMYKSWSNMMFQITELALLNRSIEFYVLLPPSSLQVKDINEWVAYHQFDRDSWVKDARLNRVNLEQFCCEIYSYDKLAALNFLIMRGTDSARKALMMIDDTIAKSNKKWWEYYLE